MIQILIFKILSFLCTRFVIMKILKKFVQDLLCWKKRKYHTLKIFMNKYLNLSSILLYVKHPTCHNIFKMTIPLFINSICIYWVLCTHLDSGESPENNTHRNSHPDGAYILNTYKVNVFSSFLLYLCLPEQYWIFSESGVFR